MPVFFKKNMNPVVQDIQDTFFFLSLRYANRNLEESAPNQSPVAPFIDPKPLEGPRIHVVKWNSLDSTSLQS